jgi:hypothetical protein
VHHPAYGRVRRLVFAKHHAVLYELFTRDSPYDENMTGQEIRDAVCSGVRPKIPASCPPRLAALMQGTHRDKNNESIPLSAVSQQHAPFGACHSVLGQ